MQAIGQQQVLIGLPRHHHREMIINALLKAIEHGKAEGGGEVGDGLGEGEGGNGEAEEINRWRQEPGVARARRPPRIGSVDRWYGCVHR